MTARSIRSDEPRGQVRKCNRSEWRISVGSRHTLKVFFVQFFNADQWSLRHSFCTFKDRKSLWDVLQWSHGSSDGMTGQKKHWRIFSSCWFLTDMSKKLNKVVTWSSHFQIWLCLNLWKSQPAACSAMSPAPYFACPDRREREKMWTRVAQLLLLYCLLSRLELAVLQLSS